MTNLLNIVIINKLTLFLQKGNDMFTPTSVLILLAIGIGSIAVSKLRTAFNRANIDLLQGMKETGCLLPQQLEDELAERRARDSRHGQQ